jgi:hypothetical protein
MDYGLWIIEKSGLYIVLVSYGLAVNCRCTDSTTFGFTVHLPILSAKRSGFNTDGLSRVFFLLYASWIACLFSRTHSIVYVGTKSGSSTCVVRQLQVQLQVATRSRGAPASNSLPRSLPLSLFPSGPHFLRSDDHLLTCVHLIYPSPSISPPYLICIRHHLTARDHLNQSCLCPLKPHAPHCCFPFTPPSDSSC